MRIENQGWSRFVVGVRRINFGLLLLDTALVITSLYASLFLRVGPEEFWGFVPTMNRHLLIFVVSRIGVNLAVGAYNIVWRYMSLADTLRLSRAVLISSLINLAAAQVVDMGRVPRAVFFIDTLLVWFFLFGMRATRRILHEYAGGKRLRESGRVTLVYGAGTNGRALLTRLGHDGDVGLKIIGFVDDDPKRVGQLVSGLPILGTQAQLAALIQEYKVRDIIIAIGQPRGELLRDVVQTCRQFGIRPHRVPCLAEIGRENRRVELIREIDLSDLLNRPHRGFSVNEVMRLIKGKRVLITGAGGTIGSELARQCLNYEPSELLLLDHSEFNLYKIDQELRVSTESRVVVPLLMDVKDRGGLERIFKQHAPQIVFHTAAYKHVHLVEMNPYHAILNNVMGTKHVLDLSLEHAIQNFVLISTDKAVNPIGVMGSTKRVCELLVAQAGIRGGLRYSSVRFGNVLGSSGSLVPMLLRQIENGEPLTITHKDVARYFILESEAIALVLRAAAIAKPGDISILKMGEPIRILDLARGLLALKGKSETDNPILFTGLRPGEKLFEDLYICGNEVVTDDPDILVLPRGDNYDIESAVVDLESKITKLIDHATYQRPEALELLNAIVRNSKQESPERPLPQGPFAKDPKSELPILLN